MSVSDSITDLPPCSPLIFDGAGQWRGSHSGTVGFKLKRLSGSFKSLRKWCHTLKDTYCFLFLSSPLGLQARCLLPCNYTPSFGGMRVSHHPDGPKELVGICCSADMLFCQHGVKTTSIHPFSVIWCSFQGSRHHWERGRNTPWTDPQPCNNIVYIV